MPTKKRSVIVTTQHRGVFFGFLSEDNGKESVVLTKARNVIHWDGKRGFLGLATHGPEGGSRIGSTAKRILLYDITSVADCTEEAEKSFSKWPQP
jgi:hypothetical protein